MSNLQQATESNHTSNELPPPSGDPKNADKYISQLIHLINTDKLTVLHTDLTRFDPSSLEDHYRLELKDYEVEVSHSKQPDSGKDFYIILFNNLKLVKQHTEKIILAYMHLNENQFKNFKSAAKEQMERKKKQAEEKRLHEVMKPIDEALTSLTDSSPTSSKDDVVTDSTQPSFTEENPNSNISLSI